MPSQSGAYARRVWAFTAAATARRPSALYSRHRERATWAASSAANTGRRTRTVADIITVQRTGERMRQGGRGAGEEKRGARAHADKDKAHKERPEKEEERQRQRQSAVQQH